MMKTRMKFVNGILRYVICLAFGYSNISIIIKVCIPGNITVKQPLDVYMYTTGFTYTCNRCNGNIFNISKLFLKSLLCWKQNSHVFRFYFQNVGNT